MSFLFFVSESAVTLRNMIREREVDVAPARPIGRSRSRSYPYGRRSSWDTPTREFSPITTFMDFVRQMNFSPSTSSSPSSPTPPSSARSVYQWHSPDPNSAVVSVDNDETDYESDQEVPSTPPRESPASPSPSVNVTPALRAASQADFDEDTVPFGDYMDEIDVVTVDDENGALDLRVQPPQPANDAAIIDVNHQHLEQLESPQSPPDGDILMQVETQPLQQDGSIGENEAQPVERISEEAEGSLQLVRVVPAVALIDPVDAGGPPQANAGNTDEVSHPECPICYEDLLQCPQPMLIDCGHPICKNCLKHLIRSVPIDVDKHCPRCRRTINWCRKIYW